MKMDEDARKFMTDEIGRIETRFDAGILKVENRLDTLRADFTEQNKALSESLHARVSSHRTQLGMEITQARRDCATGQQDLQQRVTTIEAKPCADVLAHKANDHKNGVQKNGGSWTLLRDLALIATAIGVAYSIAKDTFVTQKDMNAQRPASTVTNNK
jgi:hypothetical protein